MRTLEQTTQEILELATKHFKAAPGSLKPEDDFYKKLGIDSLQALEMLSRLENHRLERHCATRSRLGRAKCA